MHESSGIRRPGRRRLSPTLYRHVLREFLLILACCVGGFLVLFLVIELFDDLEDFLKHQAPTGVIVRYFLCLLPPHFVTLLPMALLMSTMYTVARLCRTNEMTAIRGSGISIPQSAAPLLTVGCLAILVNGLVAELFAPLAIEEAQYLRETYVNVHEDVQREKFYLAFHEPEGRRDWLVQDFSAAGTNRDVRISQYREDGTHEWELSAAEAHWEGDGRWRFHDVRRLHFDTTGEFLARPPEVAAALVLELPESPRHMNYSFFLRPTPEMAMRDLFGVMHDDRAQLSARTRAVLASYFYFRLFFPITALFAVLLGTPLALVGQRATVIRGFVLAAAIMAGYYLTTQFFLILGKNQVVSPIIAGAGPVLLFTAWGVHGFFRRR